MKYSLKLRSCLRSFFTGFEKLRKLRKNYVILRSFYVVFST